MSIGINGIYNNYLKSAIQRKSSNIVQNQSFTDTLSKTSVDSVLSDLEKKFGTKINVESVGKSQKDAERLAFRSSGNSNITIAPNILEEMAIDPELRQKIEQKIQEHFNSIPSNEQYLASRGFNMIASGVTVHEDGTVSYWIFQDQTPEEKERIRQLQEAEDKEKAKRREENKVIVKKSNDDMAASERLSRETSGSTSATTPLTADELNLAKEYKEFLDFSEALSRKANGETLDEKQKELIYGEKKPERFDTVLSFNGIQRFDMSMLYVDKTSSPAYGLPKQEYRFNAAANSISFGEGSKIPLGGHYLYIYDNITASFPSNYKQHPQNNGMKILTDYSGNGDCHALEELIYGVKNGNASWGNNMEVNGNILSLLNRMGVDTSKDFKINNVAFEVKDGVVQTKGYTASKEGATSGYSYLSGLLAKAYEQHLL